MQGICGGYKSDQKFSGISTCRYGSNNAVVAGQMCEFLENRRNIHSVYRKLPLILGGEQTVSADEPVASINRFMDELEKDERIWSASWHVGYIRHDSPVAGCGIVVVPMTEKDQEYAEEIADKLAEYVWLKTAGIPLYRADCCSRMKR